MTASQEQADKTTDDNHARWGQNGINIHLSEWMVALLDEEARRPGITDRLSFQNILYPSHFPAFETYLDSVGMAGGFRQDVLYNPRRTRARALVFFQDD